MTLRLLWHQRMVFGESTGRQEFEARYEYVWTSPIEFDEISKGWGGSQGGHRVLTQNITISVEGDSFDFVINYEVFDQQGKPTEAESEPLGTGLRIRS